MARGGRVWLAPTAREGGENSETGTRKSERTPSAKGGQASGLFLAPACLGAESDGTPDIRYVYYNYPTTGDGAVIARLVHIAAAKNPARKPTREE